MKITHMWMKLKLPVQSFPTKLSLTPSWYRWT